MKTLELEKLLSVTNGGLEETPEGVSQRIRAVRIIALCAMSLSFFYAVSFGVMALGEHRAAMLQLAFYNGFLR